MQALHPFSSDERVFRRCVMARPSDTGYIYASTKVKSADGVGTEESRLARLLDCSTVRDVYGEIVDAEICPGAEKHNITGDSDAVNAAGDILSGALDYAADLVREAVPDKSLYDFLFYKYDCNNIKAAVKSALRGVSTDGAMFSCGTISAQCAVECADTRNTSPLPRHMAVAALEAIDAYERTGEARAIDFILDRACFADMAESAAAAEVPMFTEYVKALADVTNIRSAVRISASSVAPAAAEALFARVFVPDGSVPESAFYAEGTGVPSLEALASALPLSPLKAEVAEAAENPSRADAVLERFVFRVAENMSNKAFGPEIPAYFFISREREIRRYRKALSVLSMGKVKKETLKERLGIL